MTLILLPLSLLAIFLLAGIVYNITGLAVPSHYTPYTQDLPSPIAEFWLSEWALSVSDSEAISYPSLPTPQLHSPIRLQLFWDSTTMSEPREPIDTEAVVPVTNENATSTRITKRFSIQLPLVSPVPLDSISSEIEAQKQILSAETVDGADSGTFLVALAAQERRVLELREELNKAESELTKLKRQWAQHEAYRKRQEIRQQAQPLRPIKSPVKHESLPIERTSNERLAMRQPAPLKTKSTHRKVFAGGRHTRTLSLLSPTSLANRGSISERIEVKNVEPPAETEVPTPSAAVIAPIKQQSLDLPKEDIVTTGKQIMDDLKEGLWTFIEDLKQATVGEEALSPSRARHGIHLGEAGNKKKISPRSITPPQELVPKAKDISSSPVPKSADDEEVWDNWDSPPSKSSASNTSSTTRSTPRSSMSISENKTSTSSTDQIPWPALQKLTPGHLSRTASSLMKEWERNMQPSEELALRKWSM